MRKSVPGATRWTSARSPGLVAVAAMLLSVLVVTPTPASGEEQFLEEVRVDSRDPNGATTVMELEAGLTYRFEVSGLYIFSSAIGLFLADAECSRTTSDARWTHDRYQHLADDPKDDPLSLYVQNEAVVWRPLKGTESTDGRCSPEAHIYEYFFTALETEQVTFRILDFNYADNAGSLTVRIYESRDEILVARAEVDSSDPEGSNAKTLLGDDDYIFDEGQAYRIEASGTYRYSVVPGNIADAECSTIGEDWQRNRYGFMTPLDPFDDPLDLYVDHENVDWQPLIDDNETGCNEVTHTYETFFTPGSTKAVNFRIYDFDYSVNVGVLEVRVFLAQPQASPFDSIPDLPDIEGELGAAENFVDEIATDLVTVPPIEPIVRDPANLLETEVARAVVDASDPGGVNAVDIGSGQDFIFETGVTYRIEGSGTYSFSQVGGNIADVECSTIGGDWQRNRYGTMTPHDPFDDPLDLYINNQNVEWQPLIDDNSSGCNEDTHEYEVFFTPQETGPVNFRVFDFAYIHNVGTLTARVFRQDEELLETVLVDSRSKAGTFTANDLIPGTTYRFVAMGVYHYNVPFLAYEADPHCSRAPGDEWRPDRFQDVFGKNENWLSLSIDGQQIVWAPPPGTDPDGTGCNTRDHVYQWRLGSQALEKIRPIHLAITDLNHFNNLGFFFVKIYRCVIRDGCE